MRLVGYDNAHACTFGTQYHECGQQTGCMDTLHLRQAAVSAELSNACACSRQLCWLMLALACLLNLAAYQRPPTAVLVQMQPRPGQCHKNAPSAAALSRIMLLISCVVPLHTSFCHLRDHMPNSQDRHGKGDHKKLWQGKHTATECAKTSKCRSYGSSWLIRTAPWSGGAECKSELTAHRVFGTGGKMSGRTGTNMLSMHE